MPAAEWLAHVESIPELRFVPVDNAIALGAVNLPGHLHHDPADRLIVSTAISLGARLATGDRKLRAYPHVTTIW
jgi:PIN domain nuclease of toxin-antitoxin system